MRNSIHGCLPIQSELTGVLRLRMAALPHPGASLHPLFLMGLLSFLFGCSAKPSMDDNIRALLERAGAGKYEIVSTSWDFNYAHGDFQHHFVTVAPKEDPDVQFQLRWHKPSPDGHVTPEEVVAACERARKSTTLARDYVKALQARGFTNAMVGVAGDAVDVLLFAELEPGAAEKTLGALLEALRGVPKFGGRDFAVTFLEPEALAKRARDILPTPVVRKAGGWRDEFATYTWGFLADNIAGSGPLRDQYEVATAGRRFRRYLEAAHRAALDQVAGRLPKTAFVDTDHDVAFNVAEKPPRSIWFSFPYWKKGKPDREAAAGLIEPEGYVVCLYEVDSARTSKVSLEKESR